ncbi:hypothetical protein H2199_005979 [Coniosporium tulheliwenetii]|nr:hypothetical protein H2199_005979 [Cladosporium sp. JES 115]
MTTRAKPGPKPTKLRFNKMRARSKIKRLDCITTIANNWSCKIDDALPHKITPRVATSHAPMHKAQIGQPDRELEDPCDWGCAYLRHLAEYSELTKGRHEKAVKILIEYVQDRQEDGGVMLSESDQVALSEKQEKQSKAAKFLKHARELTREDLRLILKREDHNLSRKRKEKFRAVREAKRVNKAKAQKAVSWTLPASDYYAHGGDALQPLLRKMLEEAGRNSIGQVKVEETVSGALLGEHWGSDHGLIHPSRRELITKRQSWMGLETPVAGGLSQDYEMVMDPGEEGVRVPYPFSRSCTDMDSRRPSGNTLSHVIKQEAQED